MRDIVMVIMLIVMAALLLMICLHMYNTKLEFELVRLENKKMTAVIKSERLTHRLNVTKDLITIWETFDKIQYQINDLRSSKLSREGLSLVIEELVNQYLEVHDER